jgi:hypothetical protein
MFFFLMVFELYWQTNDDVGMSMVIHGYGYMAQDSVQLIFSNVIWGHFIQLLPNLFGVPAYSWATIGVLFVVTWSLFYFLYKLGVAYWLGFLVILLIMTQAIVSPQFTINAGLLTISAVLSLITYARAGHIMHLVIACLLAYCAYLVRANEFVLVLAVALPLIPWRALLLQRRVQIAFVLLGIVIAGSAVINQAAYSASEWDLFKSVSAPGYAIIDYGAAAHLKNRPDILSKYGYSTNDIDLIAYRFTGDPRVINASALQAMIADLGPLTMQSNNLVKGWAGIQALSNTAILPLIITVFILFILFPRWQALLSLLLFLAALFALGMMGRPGIFRVYYPLVCLLLLAPLVFYKVKTWSRYNSVIATVLLLMACLINFKITYHEYLNRKAAMEQLSVDLDRLPKEILTVWGAHFPYELAYPVLDQNQLNRELKIYSLATRTLTPTSNATVQIREGNGLITRLLSDEGVLWVGVTDNVFPSGLLDIYCQEHHDRQIQISPEQIMPSLTVQRVKCVSI